MSCNLTESHPVLGALYIAHGTIYLIPYIPCIIVMVQNKLYKMPCYKIMIFMAIMDLLNLFSNAFLAGYYSIIGRSYCPGDKFMTTVGAAALGIWAGYCACCILLAFNRCIDLYSQQLSLKLFGEMRTWLWVLIPLLYGAFFASPAQPQVIYSSEFGVWFINGKPIFHTINNFLTCSALLSLYCWLVFLLWKKTRVTNSENVSAMQKQVMLQSFLICMLAVFACISYIIIQLFTVPTDFYKVAQFAWQACHGGNTMIYLTMNKTIRKGVLRLFRGQPVSNTVNVVQLMQNQGKRQPSNNWISGNESDQRRATISGRAIN